MSSATISGTVGTIIDGYTASVDSLSDSSLKPELIFFEFYKLLLECTLLLFKDRGLSYKQNEFKIQNLKGQNGC